MHLSHHILYYSVFCFCLPFFIVRPETKVNSTSAIYLNNINTTVIILCSGKGYPLPVVRWFKDGNEIDTNSTTSSDVYQVVVKKTNPKFLEWLSTILYVNPDATHSQFGNYTCNATKLKDNEQDHKIVEIVCKYIVRLSFLFKPYLVVICEQC